MTALLVLIPVSIAMGLVGLAAFLWALRRGQFDDPEGDAWRVIAHEIPPDADGIPEDRMPPHPEDRDSSPGA